jgi:adenosylcobinamide-GDP ribazoletransferase
VTPEVPEVRAGWPPVRGVRAAFTFLTRIPVGGFPYADADWRWSAAHFPLVGAVIGAIMAATWYVTAPLGAAPAAVLALIASLVVTGGFHEDGLADTADALGGGHDRARVLAILKDSRIGSFGGLALAATLLLRAALLVELGPLAPVALVASQAASRMPPIWLMALLPYATADAQSKSRQINRAGLAQAMVATGWAIAIVAGLVGVGLPPSSALALLAVAAPVAAFLGWRFWRRIDGVTGDFLGATQQVVEAAMLAATVATAAAA